MDVTQVNRSTLQKVSFVCVEYLLVFKKKEWFNLKKITVGNPPTVFEKIQFF